MPDAWFCDFLTVSHDDTVIMLEIGSVYKLKSIDGYKYPWGPPKRYLGTDCGDYELSNRTNSWYISSDSYVKATIKTVEF